MRDMWHAGPWKTRPVPKYAALIFEERRYPFVFLVSAASLGRLNNDFSNIFDLTDLTERSLSYQLPMISLSSMSAPTIILFNRRSKWLYQVSLMDTTRRVVHSFKCTELNTKITNFFSTAGQRLSRKEWLQRYPRPTKSSWIVAFWTTKPPRYAIDLRSLVMSLLASFHELYC